MVFKCFLCCWTIKADRWTDLNLQRYPPSTIQLQKMQVTMKGVMLTSLVQQQENQPQKWDGPIMDK